MSPSLGLPLGFLPEMYVAACDGVGVEIKIAAAAVAMTSRRSVSKCNWNAEHRGGGSTYDDELRGFSSCEQRDVVDDSAYEWTGEMDIATAIRSVVIIIVTIMATTSFFVREKLVLSLC